MICTRILAATLGLAGVALGQALPRRIIDVHMHAYQYDARWGRPGRDSLTGQPISAAAGPDEQRSQTLSSVQLFNIVKAVVSGDHEAVLRWRRESPEKILVGYQIVDPSKVDIAFLRREHAAGRLDAIAEVEPQYEGIRPDDPRLEPIFALAEELDIPLGLHMHPSYPGAAYRGAPKMRAANGDPLLLEDVLVRHPSSPWQ